MLSLKRKSQVTHFINDDSQRPYVTKYQKFITFCKNKACIWKFQVPYNREFQYMFLPNLVLYPKLSIYQSLPVVLFNLTSKINFGFLNHDEEFSDDASNELPNSYFNKNFTVWAIQSRICAYVKLFPFYFVCFILLCISPISQ